MIGLLPYFSYFKLDIQEVSIKRGIEENAKYNNDFFLARLLLVVRLVDVAGNVGKIRMVVYDVAHIFSLNRVIVFIYLSV
jgi:hypothetical protein